MSISIVPIGKNFAGEVSGVDLRGPLSPDIVAAIDSGYGRVRSFGISGPGH